MALVWRRRVPVVVVLALAAVFLQVVIAARWGGRTEYVSVVILGWCGALFLPLLRRPTSSVGVGWLEVLGGSMLYAAACAIAAGTYTAYHTVNRFQPLVAGLGLVVLWCGVRAVVRFWREIMLLALPLLYPLPFAIHKALLPTRFTAAVVASFLRIMGLPVTRVGTLLVFPNSTLRVFDACSGIVLMTQTLVLAVLVLAFFPTTRRRAAMVVLGGLVAGFVVNAARIALLAVVASRVPSDFDYWESYVAGSMLFPVVAVALSGVVWWRVLRTPARGRVSKRLPAATVHEA